MGNINKAVEVLISLQIIVVSSLIPVFISIPFTNTVLQIYEIPITWQIPSIIIITLIFKSEIVFTAFSIYLILGIFLLPVFQHGGSLGYLLTPNFGYLLGVFSLIRIIDNLNRKKGSIGYFNFIKNGILGIITMHFIGIVYSSIQILYSTKTNILLYDISYYSLGKVGYHFLMLTPITLLIKPINKIRCKI